MIWPRKGSICKSTALPTASTAATTVHTDPAPYTCDEHSPHHIQQAVISYAGILSQAFAQAHLGAAAQAWLTTTATQRAATAPTARSSVHVR